MSDPIRDEPCGRCGTWRRFHGYGEIQGPEYSRDHSWQPDPADAIAEVRRSAIGEAMALVGGLPKLRVKVRGEPTDTYAVNPAALLERLALLRDQPVQPEETP